MWFCWALQEVANRPSWSGLRLLSRRLPIAVTGALLSAKFPHAVGENALQLRRVGSPVMRKVAICALFSGIRLAIINILTGRVRELEFY